MKAFTWPSLYVVMADGVASPAPEHLSMSSHAVVAELRHQAEQSKRERERLEIELLRLRVEQEREITEERS